MAFRTLRILALSCLVVGLAAFAAAAADTFKIDTSHSEVGFTIRHFVTKVPGRFTQFEGDVTYDPKDPTSLAVSCKIAAASINTSNENRDKDLQSPKFFEVEKFPDITFKSKSAVKKGDNLALTGDLTMKGVTKEVVLDVTPTGMLKDGRGNTQLGFEAMGKVDRKDFGIVWNRPLEGGGTMLDDTVNLVIQVAAVKQAETPQPASR